ncbi:hypothetical protein CEQ90_13340 [Lewinellaceae bacterium SD302]|nr:hypothetical protein CEQ90_13340 [Lewinellaceae bacterium SD302]
MIILAVVGLACCGQKKANNPVPSSVINSIGHAPDTINFHGYWYESLEITPYSPDTIIFDHYYRLFTESKAFLGYKQLPHFLATYMLAYEEDHIKQLYSNPEKRKKIGVSKRSKWLDKQFFDENYFVLSHSVELSEFFNRPIYGIVFRLVRNGLDQGLHSIIVEQRAERYFIVNQDDLLATKENEIRSLLGMDYNSLNQLKRLGPDKISKSLKPLYAPTRYGYPAFETPIFDLEKLMELAKHPSELSDLVRKQVVREVRIIGPEEHWALLD